MKLFAALVVCLSAVSSWAEPVALMPYPKLVSPAGSRQWEVNGLLTAKWAGCGSIAPLQRAEQRLNRDIEKQTGLMLNAAKPSVMQVKCQSTDWKVDAGENYRLSVSAEGISIAAQGPVGVLRAFATLRQLVAFSTQKILIPYQTIDDSPRFSWRGILLDPARHFLAVSTVKRQIDAMELVKLNTLHLHLSDDQGFRVESLRYPKLNAQGEFYTQSEIRDLVDYANDRGVIVVPEFDLPGHSLALISAYPQVGIIPKDAILPGSGVLDPASEQTYSLLDGLLTEMAHLFPDPHFHMGGDEVADGAWKDLPDVKALMVKEKLADQHAVQSYFERRVISLLLRVGKVPIGWEEVLKGGVPAGVVVEAWQTSNVMAASTAAGHKTIMASGYYLNLLMPADYLYEDDPAATTGTGIAPELAEPLRKKSPLIAHILTDALVDFPHPPLTADQEKLLVGGEASLWGEIVTDDLVDHVLWPRAAVIAERFWSPASLTDVRSMYQRLAVVSDQLSVCGLQDRASEARMSERLAPGQSDPVATLLSVTGPVRNFTHDHRIRAMLAGKQVVQSFNQPADAAPVDSLTARQFFYQVQNYLGGQRSLAKPLRAQLTMWQENDARFQKVAAGNASLEPALPTAAQIALLAQAGLKALAALESATTLATPDQEKANALLKEVAAQEAASWIPLDAFLHPQPPADLIVKIGPAIQLLVDAAARAHQAQ